MRVLAVIGFALALAAMPAFAGDLEDGARFLKNKDYARAVRSFRKAAEQGDAHAQYVLGFMYEEGKGVAQDNGQAVFWLGKAAAQGNADAKSKLATIAKTSEDRALEAMTLCERRSASELDDGVSSADVVASAVIAKCSRERDLWLTLRDPRMDVQTLRQLRPEVDRLSLPGITRTILEYRAEKRQAQEIEKNNPQSSPARPK